MPQTRQGDHWVFLPPVLLLSTASNSAKPEKAEVPKLNSDASDQSGRRLGLSTAGSASRSFTGPLLQFAHESAKPEEAGEAEESMERPSLTSEESLSPLQTVIVAGPNAESALGEVSVQAAASVNPLNVPPGVEHPVDPPAIKLAPKSPVSRGEEDHDTESDLEAIVASFEDGQLDPPHARSVRAENIVDQEISQMQPNMQTVYLDCPDLGGSQLFSESAEHVLTAPKVGNRHQVYGPTLAPADTFLQSQVQIARRVTVGVHTFSQLMFDIADVEREWANVSPSSP